MRVLLDDKRRRAQPASLLQRPLRRGRLAADDNWGIFSAAFWSNASSRIWKRTGDHSL
jgi:hypothetical protein